MADDRLRSVCSERTGVVSFIVSIIRYYQFDEGPESILRRLDEPRMGPGSGTEDVSMR